MELLIATRSVGKIREIRRILDSVPGLIVRDLRDLGIEPEPAEDDLEPYDTFEQNALSKARYFFEKSGIPTVADDSGIEVDALAGAPGVRSKRFAPDRGLEGQELDNANNTYMIERLAGVAAENRTARYVCVAAFVEGETEPRVFRGEAPGLIVDEPRGSGGFGYDPYVFDTELGVTFAEMSGPKKDGRSHRGRAFRELAETLRTRLACSSESD